MNIIKLLLRCIQAYLSEYYQDLTYEINRNFFVEEILSNLNPNVMKIYYEVYETND
jgi:hypothetical protein